MKSYAHLATRLFGVPLLISRSKLEAILAAVGPRLGMTVETAEPAAYGPGDKGRDRKPYYVTEDGIAVIEIIGPLVKRNSGEFLSGGPTTYGEIETEFTDAVMDPNIQGILLLVDSPGGEAVGSMELSDLIYGQRGTKPIFAAADGDAFSAAYALASAADQVYVAKSGGVGSVGVWLMHVDQSAYNEKEGVKPTFLFAGARKIDGNPHEPLSDEARKVFQDLVDGTYEMFVSTVARNRGLTAAAVRATEAGLFFGQPKTGNPSAVDVGFADAVGSVSDAMAEMRRRMASTSSVARSATGSTERREMQMENSEVADAQQQPPEAAAAAAEPAAAGESAAPAPFERAKQIVQLCALAGLTARQALAFLKPESSIDSIRQELLDARAAEGGPEIHAHVLPEAGAMGGKDPDDSPLVKVAEARAAARGGK